MGAFRVGAFLLDSPERWSEGQARPPIPWPLAREAAARGRVLLSAGLTPANVAAAAEIARPWGVDVSQDADADPVQEDAVTIGNYVLAVDGSGRPSAIHRASRPSPA